MNVDSVSRQNPAFKASIVHNSVRRHAPKVGNLLDLPNIKNLANDVNISYSAQRRFTLKGVSRLLVAKISEIVPNGKSLDYPFDISSNVDEAKLLERITFSKLNFLHSIEKDADEVPSFSSRREGGRELARV